MKIRLGGQAFGNGNVAEVERKLGEILSRQIKTRVVTLSKKFVATLRIRLLEAATAEANKLFDVIVDLMDRTVYGDPGIDASDLLKGVDLSSGIPRPTGRVDWRPLSTKYAMFKSRRSGSHKTFTPGNENRMFRYNDGMRTYFKGSGNSIIQRRLGGITVTIAEIAGNNTDAISEVGRPDENTLNRLLLDKITVHIFPNVTSLMAPGLATRKWNDVSDTGDLEKDLFGGTLTARKLMNRADAYRPLLTPTLQFFMLTRIPNAVKQSLNKYLNKTQSRTN